MAIDQIKLEIYRKGMVFGFVYEIMAKELLHHWLIKSVSRFFRYNILSFSQK